MNAHNAYLGLIVVAFGLTICSAAIGKPPLWVALLLVTIALALAAVA